MKMMSLLLQQNVHLSLAHKAKVYRNAHQLFLDRVGSLIYYWVIVVRVGGNIGLFKPLGIGLSRTWGRRIIYYYEWNDNEKKEILNNANSLLK